MSKEPAKKIDPVELVDRIPDEKVDLKRLAEFCHTQLANIETDRDAWLNRREIYLDDIDNFCEASEEELRFEGAAQLHIPVTLEKVRATHARLLQALFAVQPPFYTEPQEKLDVQRLQKINQLMKWAVSRGANYYKGIQEALDDFIWNFSAEGWGFLHLKWDCLVRKALVIKEEIQKNKKAREQKDAYGNLIANPPVRLKEQFEWLKIFEGAVVENIQNEDAFFPGYGDIQKVPLVGIRSECTSHDFRYLAASKYYIQAAVDIALKYPDSNEVTDLATSTTIRDRKGTNQGVTIEQPHTVPETFDRKLDRYVPFICYCSFDVDNDGFKEELIVHYHPSSRQVLRWTYLDRTTRTGRRPVYKADYIRRPGRNYSLGLCEMLHSLSMEVDAIHEQRVDNGTLSNMPFFFYRASSVLPNEPIKIAAGKGIPIENPTQDVLFPQIKGGTAWGFQEENLLFNIISRISSISDISVGQPVSPAEMTRTQGGVAALLNEGNAQLDIALRRIQEMYGELLSDMHQMYTEKLPRDFEHIIVGEDGQTMTDPQTQMPVMNTIADPRREIAGRVHFFLKANSASGNKQLMRQQRTVLFQQLLNPFNLQLGLVGPEELYEMNKALLETSEEPDPGRFLKKPQSIPKPLSLMDELDMIKQGLMPEIPINDDHAKKIQMIQLWMNSPQVQQGLQIGTISGNAMVAAQSALELHQSFLQAIQAQQQMFQNSTGSQMNMMTGGNRGAMGQTGAVAPLPVSPSDQPQQSPVAPTGGPVQ